MKKSKNVIALLLASVIWGAAFIAQRTGGDAIGAYSFTCIRSFIAFVVLIPVEKLIHKIKKEQEPVRTDFKTLLTGGIVCGLALCLASNLQQVGISLGAAVGKAGFLTTFYIIFVPILGLFLKKKCGWNVGLGVILAFCGLYLLCMKDGNLGLTLPDTLLILCGLVFAIQILAIDHFSVLTDVIKLSRMQMLFCGIFSLIPTFLVDMQHSVSGIAVWSQALCTWDAWIPLLYAGICSSGIAYTLQVVGQQDFNPTIASLLMSLESAFSLIFGWLLLHEVLSQKEIAGCIVIFAAVILAQLPVTEWIRAKRKA